jgi:hypothetical protein
MELFMRPLCEGADQVVVCGKGDDHPTIPWVQLGAFNGNAAPVGIVSAGERRLRVVFGSLNCLGDERAHAVGADDDAGVLRYYRTVRAMTADADDAVAVPANLL